MGKKPILIGLATLLLPIVLILPSVFAGNYGAGTYGAGVYGVGEVPAVPDSPGGGGGGGSSLKLIDAILTGAKECLSDSDCGTNQYCFDNVCYAYECLSDSNCNVGKGEVCWNHRCVKLFDMEILEFESPVKVGEFFDFTYFLKAVAEINGDVEIKFWIEQDGDTITSGQDTIYFSSFEEKTKTKKLFLPEDISSGTYIFYIEVTLGTYTASAHRTIGIEVKDGLATIIIRSDFTQYLVYGLIGLAAFILFFIFYLEKRKIKKLMMQEEKYIKKYRVSILVFLLFIILGILVYYLKWYELIANWIPKGMPYFNSYWHYIFGGIIAFIAIIILIFLIRRNFKKKTKSKGKLKAGTCIKYKKRIGKNLKKIVN